MQLGKLIGVPNNPPNFLPRDQDLQQLKAMVLESETASVAITGHSKSVAVQGMGGIGKSVMAAALVRDEEIRAAFRDGIYWVALGQEPNLLSLQTQLAKRLEDTPPEFSDIEQGKIELQRRWGDKRGLLVVDDVWQMRHLSGLSAIGSNTKLVITTRDLGIATGLGAEHHSVKVLSRPQSLALLAQWSGQAEAALPAVASEVADQCGDLPLALSMAGAMVQGNPNRWPNVLKRLEQADLDKIKQEFSGYPYPDLLKAIQVSVDVLNAEEQTFYLGFAVFPEEIEIPQSVLEVYWQSQGLDALDVDDLVILLSKRSLLQRDGDNRIKLHDLQYDYVCQQISDPISLHQRLMDAYSEQSIQDDYYWTYWAYHEDAAQNHEQLQANLLNFRFLASKLTATDVTAVLGDFNYISNPTTSLVKEAIRLSAHVLLQEPEQLAGRLRGHLLSHHHGDIQAFLASIQPMARLYWLSPIYANLTPAGGPLIRTLSGP